MRGVASHDRIDEELYQDYETADAKQARGRFSLAGRAGGGDERGAVQAAAGAAAWTTSS